MTNNENINALAISGAAGTGKTTIANEIGQIMRWKVVGAGNDFRAIRGVGANIGASTGTSAQHDSIDDRMLMAMTAGEAVAEGRVAGVVAYLNNLQNTKRILLVCDAELSAQRIWERELARKSCGRGTTSITLDQVRITTNMREADNLRIFTKRWGESYLNSRLYHLTINTGNYNVEQTLEMVMAAIGCRH